MAGKPRLIFAKYWANQYPIC